MLQIRQGDLIAVNHNGNFVLFAILTKQILFGGHWSFVFHGAHALLPTEDGHVAKAGFNAAVDFIWPKREERVLRISRGKDFSSLMGPELLKQEPAKGQVNYRIWRWKGGLREVAEYVRFTPTPNDEEMAAPYYTCIPADFACELAAQEWTVQQSKWNT